jgi:hypothetical protein
MQIKSPLSMMQPPPQPMAMATGKQTRMAGPQPRSGPPMPPHPTLQPPTSNTPHHRSNSLAKSKTGKGKQIIPQPQFATPGGRAKPTAEY